jgi:rhodanese-related sulfurtransferase
MTTTRTAATDAATGIDTAPAEVRTGAATLTAALLEERLARGERFQLIDVRTPREYDEGHVPGALNLPMDQAEARIEDLHPHDPVVLICQSGRRAEMTCSLLKPHRGNLLVLEGGTKAWKEAGFPVVQTVSSRLPLMRQVQIGAGSLVLLGTLLSLRAHPAWIALAILVGAGLVVAGTTGFCGMALLLARAPWNRPTARLAAPPACCGQ